MKQTRLTGELGIKLREHIDFVESAPPQHLSQRLSGLAQWLDKQSEIRPVLKILSSEIDWEQSAKELRRGWGSYGIQATRPEEVAAVGYLVCKLCAENANLHLSDLAALGILHRDNGEKVRKTVMEGWVRPFFAYLLQRFPAPPKSKLNSSVLAPAIIPPSIRESLGAFRKDYPTAARAGFIMMRFGKTKAHGEIVKAIRDTLMNYELSGLRADDKDYHEDLFPNIQTYMHGCQFGIAVFERIEQEDFNPNIALEVGYMLALRKPVLLLKDKTLKHLQTDLVGKLYRPFDPQDPAATIPREVNRWLEDRNLA